MPLPPCITVERTFEIASSFRHGKLDFKAPENVKLSWYAECDLIVMVMEVSRRVAP